jgi:protein-tyrosine-phosphatase
MAEAFLNQLCPQEFQASSAGLEPATINPLVVEVMREVGIDLAGKQTQDVWTLAKRGSLFAFVISVCAELRRSIDVHRDPGGEAGKDAPRRRPDSPTDRTFLRHAVRDLAARCRRIGARCWTRGARTIAASERRSSAAQPQA